MLTVTVYHFTCPTAGAPGAVNRLAPRQAFEALHGAERILFTGIAVEAAVVEKGFLRADYDWTEGCAAPAFDHGLGR